jgi:hypothetical protein
MDLNAVSGAEVAAFAGAPGGAIRLDRSLAISSRTFAISQRIAFASAQVSR